MYKSAIIIATLLLFVQFVQPVSAKTSQPTAACEQLTESLSRKTPLTGSNIQLSPASFLEQNSHQQLSFSTVLAEGLAVALSTHGAIVSVREQGEKPLRLLGIYHLRDDQLSITVRIREMGKSKSSDLAVAQIVIDRDDLQEAWFKSDLTTLTLTLIKELENKLSGFDDPIVTVAQPQPGIPGQPTLQFGTELRKQLELAISNSELLGAASFGIKRSPYQLQTSYSRIAGVMRVELRLLGPDANPAARAQADISEQQISSGLFALLDDRDLTVCIQYKQRDRRDIKEHSTQADSLIDGISGALARFGTHSTACDVGDSAQGIRILASMRLNEKNTRDGYGSMRGNLKMTILDGDGKVISTLSAKEKTPFSGSNDSTVEKLIEKIFDAAFQEELAAHLLSR